MKKIALNSEEILIATIGGTYHTIGNTCTHQGRDLSKGSLDGNIGTCPRHQSRFDVTTGKSISGPKILFLTLKVKDEPLHPVKVEGNDLLMNLN